MRERVVSSDGVESSERRRYQPLLDQDKTDRWGF